MSKTSLTKPLALPRMYLRTNHIEIDIDDDLAVEEPLLHVEIEATKADTILEPLKGDTKKRPPTQYNLFIKENMALLANTRPDLIGKERFKYAVSMWNERKKQQQA
jgi:hypothetical protein